MQAVVVHTFSMGDVEDPDIMVADPIWQWQQTEQGQWIMAKSLKPPMWRRSMNMDTWGYQYDIVAWLADSDLTFWRLKHG